MQMNPDPESKPQGSEQPIQDVIWYIEELDNGRWVDGYIGYRLSREKAISWMESRKREYPRAKLRLVCRRETIWTYRNRNKSHE